MRPAPILCAIFTTLIGACGGAELDSVDASAPDTAAPDAATPDAVPIDGAVDAAAPLTVPILVREDDGSDTSRAGAIVLIHDAANALVSRTVTGADGRVTVTVPFGGSVTVFRDHGAAAVYATTIFHVTSNVELRFGRRPPVPVVAAGTMTVTAPMHPTAPETWLTDGCGTARVIAGTAALPIYTACAAGSHDLIVYGRAAGGDPTDAFVHANAIYAAGAGVIATGTFTPLATSTVTVTPGFSGVAITIGTAGGARSYPGSRRDSTSPPSTVPVLPRGDLLTTTTTSALGRSRTDVVPIAAAVAVPAIDLPFVTTLSHSIPTHQIEWRTAFSPEPPGLPDAIYAALVVDNLGPRPGYWLAVAPPDWTEVTVPELPPDLSLGNPNTNSELGFAMHESSTFSTYEAFIVDAERELVRRTSHAIRPGEVREPGHLATVQSPIDVWAP